MTITRPDDEACYAALSMRDERYDGWFFAGVRTTGVYCRPSCPARTPKRQNTTFYPTAAAAQAAGYRACLRCRPDAVPGSPAYDHAASVAASVMRLVDEGYVESHGVHGLASRLGYSERQLNRITTTQLGSGPLQLARARRAHAARILVQTTQMPFADVAFAAGFGSIRQFNDTLREVFASTPTQLRGRRSRDVVARACDAVDGPPAGIELRLAHREPYDTDAMWHHLALHVVPGVEEILDGVFRRVLTLPGGPGVVELWPAGEHIGARLHLADLRDLTTAVARCRRVLDLDADPVGREAVLRDAGGLDDLTDRHPGLRIPGSVDAFETVIRIVLAQQISLAAGNRLAGLLSAERGRAIVDPRPDGGLTHAFPTPAELAADPIAMPMPASRNTCLDRVADLVATGKLDLDPASDPDEVTAELTRLPGIGRWTTDAVRIRALGDPDVLLSGDLVIRRIAEGRGLPGRAGDLDEAGARWRPLRSLATHLLWTVATDERTR